ncbi:hypothetical protein M514_00115 [Trichuris suis]|uniref:Uncharacterized protein n=1 Tax=Trichuris suis TaxID=68888 RepID=A0A085NU34_9BILA|nr:hypothetical protein M513_00115 [Trichuris suis]KFD72980.1 hypothetical protein M514_00115 [Trichuris suis]KHJ43254.1 hypothetical protein D918_06488 [Trichuris suis]
MIVEEVHWAPEFSTVNTIESSLMWMQVDDDGDSGCPCLPEPPIFNLGPPPLPVYDALFKQAPGSSASFDGLTCPVEAPEDDLNSFYATMHDGSFPSVPVSPIVFVLGVVTVTALVAVSIMALAFFFARRTAKRNGFKTSTALRKGSCFHCYGQNGINSPASPTVQESSTKSDLSYYSVRPILKGHFPNLDTQMSRGNCFERSAQMSCPDGASVIYEEIPSGYYVGSGENSTIESACFAPVVSIESSLKNLEMFSPPSGSCVGQFAGFTCHQNKLRCARSTSPGLTLNTGCTSGEAGYPRSKYKPTLPNKRHLSSTGFLNEVKTPSKATVVNDGPWL